MKLEDQIYKSLHEYPSLFYHSNHPTLSDFEISRLAVLEHLFMTIGNGYAWVLGKNGGYLCDCDEATGTDFEYDGLGWTARGPKYEKIVYPNREWPPARKYDTVPNEREKGPQPYPFAWEYVENWMHYDEVLHGGKTLHTWEWPFSIYPAPNDWFRFPEFVQPDWLQGAKDICEFAIAYFASKTSRDGNGKKIPAKMRRHSTEILQERLNDINRRLSDAGKEAHE